MLVACGRQTYVVGELSIYKDDKPIVKVFTNCRKNAMCDLKSMRQVRSIGNYTCDLEGNVYYHFSYERVIKQPTLTCKVRAYEVAADKLPNAEISI